MIYGIRWITTCLATTPIQLLSAGHDMQKVPSRHGFGCSSAPPADLAPWWEQSRWSSSVNSQLRYIIRSLSENRRKNKKHCGPPLIFLSKPPCWCISLCLDLYRLAFPHSAVHRRPRHRCPDLTRPSRAPGNGKKGHPVNGNPKRLLGYLAVNVVVNVVL